MAPAGAYNEERQCRHQPFSSEIPSLTPTHTLEGLFTSHSGALLCQLSGRSTTRRRGKTRKIPSITPQKPQNRNNDSTNARRFQPISYRRHSNIRKYLAGYRKSKLSHRKKAVLSSVSLRCSSDVGHCQSAWGRWRCPEHDWVEHAWRTVSYKSGEAEEHMVNEMLKPRFRGCNERQGVRIFKFLVILCSGRVELILTASTCATVCVL